MKTKTLLHTLVVILIHASACTRGGDLPPVVTPPVPPPVPQPNPVSITSFSPDRGPHSVVVTIYGSGFSINPADDTVRFNGRVAIITEATETKLTAIVPKGAGTGPVTVSVKDRKATGDVFTYLNIFVSTWAGNFTSDCNNGIGTEAQFVSPQGMAVDRDGNLIVADMICHQIRKITPTGVVSTLAGDNVYHASGYVDGNAAQARFSQPVAVAVDKDNNIFVIDQANHRIRKITPAGVVSTVAGDGTKGYKDGPALTAKFNLPYALAVDSGNHIIVTDMGNHRIRKISRDGMVSTLAGDGTQAHVDGTGVNASFYTPSGLAIDAKHNLYVGQRDKGAIRKVSPEGVVTTVAGGGSMGGYLDGSGSNARFWGVAHLALDAYGDFIIVDWIDGRIRRMTPTGTVSTIAGNGNMGFRDGDAAEASFHFPIGVAIDKTGNIFIGDSRNYRIRKIRFE